jgi:hypothetical protein
MRKYLLRNLFLYLDTVAPESSRVESRRAVTSCVRKSVTSCVRKELFKKPAEKQMTLSLEIMMTCKDDPSQKPSHLALRHIPYELNLSE